MDGNHPNRKKDKLNPYILSVENNSCYVSFADEQKNIHKIEISMELYAAFNSFELEDLSQINVVNRHMVQSDIAEEMINRRAAESMESVEDQVYRRILYKELHNAIAQLPVIQRRRLLLYYFGGYTYEEIAKMEGCKHPAIMKSVAAAKRNIHNLLSQ